MPPGSTLPQALAQRRLGAVSIVGIVMAAAAPLTVVAGGAVSAFATTGVTGIPIGYLAIAVILGVFAIGYVAMARHITNAGAAYAYVTAGLGRVAGVAAAGIAVLAYNGMQSAFVGGFGVAAARVLNPVLGTAVPWWLPAAAAWLGITLLTLAKVDLSGRILAVLLTGECLIVVVFAVAFFADPSSAGITVSPIDPTQLLSPVGGTILVIAFAGFVGLEGSSVFAEETTDATRTVRRATYASIIAIGLLYFVAAWAITVATGPTAVVDSAAEHGTDLIFVLAGQRLPGELVWLGRVLFASSLFAGLLAWSNVASRYHFALGREGVLPRRMGATSSRTGAPRNGAILQSILSGLALVVTALTGMDPTTHLFYWGSATAALGVLALLTATSVAVAAFFLRRGDRGLRTVAAPILAALALGAVLVATVTTFHTVLGVDPGSVVAWLLPSAYLAAAVLGGSWALVLRSRRPHVWRRIGKGAHADRLAHDAPADHSHV